MQLFSRRYVLSGIVVAHDPSLLAFDALIVEKTAFVLHSCGSVWTLL